MNIKAQQSEFLTRNETHPAAPIRSADSAAANTLQQREPQIDISKRFDQLQQMIGNTPLLAIHFTYKGRPRIIYAKAEYLSLTGSIKDRMAFHILREAYREGKIKPGDTIAEATSGNTGIAFSAVGKALGHAVVIYMPDWMSQERVALISSFGAEIVPVSREAGGFLGSIELSEQLAAMRGDVFLPCQFSNQANIEAHARTTAPEIWRQLGSIGRPPDAFVAGVGTGGTIMGVGKFLREKNPSLRLHPIEPLESPTLSTGYKIGSHRIQGISDEFIPKIVELAHLDSVIGVSDGDAILMAQMLAARLGLAVGISSGANFLGALKAQNALGDDTVVATVLADDNKKYLSTDLLRKEPLRNDYLSPDVKFGFYEAIKRADDHSH